MEQMALMVHFVTTAQPRENVTVREQAIGAGMTNGPLKNLKRSGL